MFWKIMENVVYTIRVYYFMDVRERNRVIHSGEFRKFCNSKYVTIPINGRKSLKKGR